MASKYEELECLYAAVGKVIYEGLTNYEKATSANPSQLFGECASCLAHVSLLTWTGLPSGKGTACREELWADGLLRECLQVAGCTQGHGPWGLGDGRPPPSLRHTCSSHPPSPGLFKGPQYKLSWDVYS